MTGLVLVEGLPGCAARLEQVREFLSEHLRVGDRPEPSRVA